MMDKRHRTTQGFVAEKMIGRSAACQSMREDVACAARSDAKVLITGESGVGKEVVARLIHERSARSHRTFVALNCAGLPDSLLETELFGHERGSFTGADRDRLGMLAFADHGTLMLDEVGEMSLRMQALLLRFLETGELQRVGGRSTERTVDVRVIAATNRNLLERVDQGAFRSDLYYRLNVIRIAVPPLRDRREDIPLMISHFLERQSRWLGLPTPSLPPDVMTRLTVYDWPGNVREVKNIIERLIVRAGAGDISLTDLPAELREPASPPAARPTTTVDRTEAPLAESLVSRMVDGGESFWQVVHDPLMSRDLTRATVREVITRGLERTHGSYRLLVELFNMRSDDYGPLLSTLRKLGCYVPFKPFRDAKPAPSASESVVSGKR